MNNYVSYHGITQSGHADFASEVRKRVCGTSVTLSVLVHAIRNVQMQLKSTVPLISTHFERCEILRESVE